MIKNVVNLTSVIFVLVLLISKAFSNPISNLMKHTSQEGAMINVNKAGIVKDQHGGYLTGGSVVLRGPRPKTLLPLTIQTPKFAFDACTGSSDFRFGGLSFIQSREFTQFFKNTAMAAGSYAVKMLIKSACPQCEDIMSYLETVARDINGLMMDQCAMSQIIGEGVFNKLSSANQQICMMRGNINKESKDMHESSEKCKSNPDGNKGTGEENELKSMLGDEFNLVWKALSQGSGDGDKSFKELIMSVSGTIIGKKVNGSLELRNKPSLVLSSDLLDKYIGVNKGTSKVKLYQCDSREKCLNPEEIEQKLKEKDTIYGNISRILEKLIPKIEKNRDELTDEEASVIAFSSVPIIQLIEMELAEKAKAEDMIIRMQEFVEMVCYDVVTGFLSEMLRKATSSVQSLEYSQLDNTVIENFIIQAGEVRQFLTDSKFAAFKRLQLIMQVKGRLIQQQRMFKAGFARYVEYNNED